MEGKPENRETAYTADEMTGGTSDRASGGTSDGTKRADIVKSGNSDDELARYEKLLLKRDALLREAEQYQHLFIKEFGELLVESFRIRIECIRKKKAIAYCQKQVNMGRRIDGARLDSHIEREMADYQSQLEAMIMSSKAAREAKRIPEYDVFRIKKIYRGLARLIHPDLHPELAGDLWLQELWSEIVLAYKHNCLDDLEELDFQVRKHLEGLGELPAAGTISNLSARITALEKKVEKITSTDPYLYKLILDEEDAIRDKKRQLRSEIEEYTEYSRQLDEVIARFNIERMYS